MRTRRALRPGRRTGPCDGPTASGRAGRWAEGIEHPLRSPVRSTVLALASRTALGALAVTAAVLASVPLWPTDSGVPASAAPRAVAVGASPVIGDGGTTMADLLTSVDRETRAVRASIVELDVVPTVGPDADVLLRIDVHGGDASSVAAVVAALGRAQLDAVRVRSITPVPSGSRLEVTAQTSRASMPLSVSPVVADAEPSIVLADLVQRSGAELRRLEVRDASGGVSASAEGRTIRLAARGEARAIVTLLDALEHTHTAPLRFLSLRIEGSGDGHFDLTTAFRPREALATSTPAGAS